MATPNLIETQEEDREIREAMSTIRRAAFGALSVQTLQVSQDAKGNLRVSGRVVRYIGDAY